MQLKIIAQNVVKTYESNNGDVLAIDNFNLEVADGEFVCIVGPSGCGKSTFLRILAGLVPQTSGTIEIKRSENSQKPLNSMVFQEYAIYPWKNVRDNVAFGLQMRGIGKKERFEVADDWLKRVGLSKFSDYYPHQLSGGMKQRVSIARALANDPEVLLMDEPLGALDAQTRTVMQDEFLKLWEIDRKTVVYITHSIDEAILLGDRVIIMTAHPGTKKVEFTVDIPRPRTIETMATPEFGHHKGMIWDALKDEVSRAYGEQV
ncbi:MAG: ABC transporter ATP-binding protein [Aggregatilineales bacterium]